MIDYDPLILTFNLALITAGAVVFGIGVKAVALHQGFITGGLSGPPRGPSRGRRLLDERGRSGVSGAACAPAVCSA